jgi:hypothetical protein
VATTFDLRGTSGRFEIDVRAAARNLLLWGSPEVDFEGRVTVDVAPRTIRFDGRVDQIPAFEMYGSVDIGMSEHGIQRGSGLLPTQRSGSARHGAPVAQALRALPA